MQFQNALLRRLPLLVPLIMATAPLANAAATIEERMTQAQFKTYGLDKLSAAELRGLNEWLSGQSAARPAAAGESVDRDPRQGFREPVTQRVAVHAHLVGTFTGWNGSTIFKLDNGQEWQQTEGGALRGQTAQNPEVTIKPKVMGNWLLVVEFCQCRVGVRRIK